MNGKEKHKKRRLLFLLLILAGLVIIFFLIPFFLPKQTTSEIRNWIRQWDSPETVAVKMLCACRDGDLKAVSGLLSADSLTLLYTRAVLTDPAQTPEETLKRFAEKNQTDIKEAVFEAKRDLLSPPEETGRVRVTVQVFSEPAEPKEPAQNEDVPAPELKTEPQPLLEFPVDLVKEPSGWKCDCLDEAERRQDPVKVFQGR